MDDIVSYQFTKVRQRRDERQEIQYELILRQQPKQSRMCGIGEKADRRPIDPPPIIQLKVYDASLPQSEKSSFLQNPYFFMYASLVAPDTDEELHLLRDGKTRSTTGSVVSSLYHLKDIDNSDAGFFVFPDLSVRMEGTYRLKLSLFEIIGREVYHCKSIFSDIFIVYSAKRFPGMEESTFLSRSFADQGLKIRIRKEIRIRRRLAKRDRKELELIDHSRLKRPRPDGKRDDDSGESSDADLHTPTADDTRSKLSPEIIHSSYDKRKDHNSISPSSPRRMYEHMPPHMPHYDPNAPPMYGPGYPPHRPHSWHDRPEYMTDPHYPPYYDPYDRRYGYHPYYYPHPPPMPDGSEHHRYPYPAYGRPPMYPGQPAPGYYDAPPRVGHPPNDSPGAVRPYGYDPSGTYPPQRWPHYGERSQSRDPNLEPSSSPYRGSAPVTPPPPRGHPIYPYSDYYPSYPHPPIPPLPPKTADYAPVPPIDTSGDPNNPQSKIPIQNLFATAPPAPHPSRIYGGPSAFAHIYPHPARPHEYMRHDLYGRPPYDVGYPPRDAAVSPYGTPSSNAVNKSQPVSQPSHSQQGDTARTSLILPPTSTSMTSSSSEQSRHNIDYNNTYERRSVFSGEPSTSTSNPPSTNPSSTTSSSQTSSSYSGMPIIPTATRTTVTLPSLVPLSINDRNERFVASSSSGNSIPTYHSATSASPLHTTTPSSQQLNSPQSQPSQPSYEHPYSHSTSNSQNRGSFGITSGSDHGNGGNNSSKNNGVKPSLSSGSNEKTSPRAAGFEGNYPLRRQGGDAED
ncbi:6927_t:CDS:2 [Funneliformis geosporum]|uniref:6927_t:CDS:1 n=1 Tax=Funneliformis geosporum TaxID=1117311 RepID=A0A9W4SG49_9GLOM|nr:6927_t:CDS:2 [Funneliformis geosporum]